MLRTRLVAVLPKTTRQRARAMWHAVRPGEVRVHLGERVTIHLRGHRDQSLIAKSRAMVPALRLRSEATRTPRGEVAFSVPLSDLLPRGLAHATLDLFRERRGVETRIPFPPALRTGISNVSDGVAVFAYPTTQQTLALSMFRTEIRRPLRLVILLHQFNYTGGKTRFVFDLAGNMQAAGFDVTLTALWLTPKPIVYQPPAHVRLRFIDSHMLRRPGEPPVALKIPTLSGSKRSMTRMQEYFRTLDADVVYCPDYDSALYDTLLDNLPTRVLSILGDHSGERYGSALAAGHVPIEPERHRLFHAAIQRFDAIHVVNPVVLDAYRASTAKTVFCITNAVDSTGPRRAEYLKQRRMIAAGRLVGPKQFDALLRAFSLVHERHPDWSLDLYGDGPQRDPLLALVFELGLEDVVVLRDPTPRLKDEMRSSSIHVSTSIAESFGLTIAEAMSVGLPVISLHRHPGAAYLLGDGRGVIPEIGSVDALAAAMDSMMTAIEGGDPEGLIREMTLRAADFTTDMSAQNATAAWSSEIVRLYDDKIARLYE